MRPIMRVHGYIESSEDVVKSEKRQLVREMVLDEIENTKELLALWDQNRNSVIFVTHDVEEALLLSDRILVLSRPPGTVIGEVPVHLPRPRSTETTLTEEFLVLKRRIVHLLRMQADPVNPIQISQGTGASQA